MEAICDEYREQLSIDEEWELNMPKHITRRTGLGTNRKYNSVNYYMMSDWDCYTLCLNTHNQINKMAKECELSAGQMFLFWHRFATYCSFQRQSTIIGLSASSLQKWYHETKKKLCVWSDKYLIHGDKNQEQKWNRKTIQNSTPDFITRLHDPMGKGHVILCMDGTYIKTQQNQKNFGLRRLTWSSHKNYTLVKPHLICTLGGLFLFFVFILFLFFLFLFSYCFCFHIFLFLFLNR